MKKSIAFIVLVFSIVLVQAQKISYILSFPNINHHEASISLVVSGLTQRTAVFRMSRSSPGRYATHEYGKNVYDVKAFDKTGKQITIEKTDGDVYQVARHDGFVRVEYTLFANHPDGTYAGIDPGSIHLNAPATYLWLKGADTQPIDISFNLPSGKNWTIATQLKPAQGKHVFTARNLQYLMDSPVKIGDLYWQEWTQSNPDKKSYKIRLALEARTTDEDAQKFAKGVEKITKECQAVFGELPAFDYGTYTFLVGINPYVKGDGMEHRNSTVIHQPGARFNPASVPGVFMHEFFHCWNVERIRPKTLEPFNFEKSNMSNELWFAEGFTQYYGTLVSVRAGFTEVSAYTNTLAGLINTKENTPGAKKYSPIDASRHAVFVDAGVSIDKNNYQNMFSSYYTYGASVALALDLELRARAGGLSLDDFMKAAWKKFGVREIAYNVDGLEDVLATVTNDKNFAASFFQKYIHGHESFNYGPLLEKAGFKVSTPGKGTAWLGMPAFKSNTNLAFANGTIIGTAYYDAGLDVDDLILQLDGKPVSSQADVNAIIEQHKPGDKIIIQYSHRETVVNTEIVFAENPLVTVSSFEKDQLTLSAESKAFRESWLGSKVK